MSRFIRGMLYGLQPSDPLTFGGAVLLLLAIALLAGWRPGAESIPARSDGGVAPRVTPFIPGNEIRGNEQAGVPISLFSKANHGL